LLFTGGDDHALAATFPTAAAVPEGWFVIGSVAAADHDHNGVVVDGKVWESSAGFEHFRSPRPSEARR
jgi:thiamine-monophosphate kinase